MRILVLFVLLLAAVALATVSQVSSLPAPVSAATGQSNPIAVPAAVWTSAPTATPTSQTIVDIAVADGRFKTLVAALNAAGLTETLKGPGPFTVFAPTDDAFAKLPPGTVDALLQDPVKLKGILLYHVVPGRLTAADVVKHTELQTAQGATVKITVSSGKVMINNATVIQPDVSASNGIIHVIDTVLLPPGS